MVSGSSTRHLHQPSGKGKEKEKQLCNGFHAPKWCRYPDFYHWNFVFLKSSSSVSRFPVFFSFGRRWFFWPWLWIMFSVEFLPFSSVLLSLYSGSSFGHTWKFSEVYMKFDSHLTLPMVFVFFFFCMLFICLVELKHLASFFSFFWTYRLRYSQGSGYWFWFMLRDTFLILSLLLFSRFSWLFIWNFVVGVCSRTCLFPEVFRTNIWEAHWNH